jgi:hypothetical protein
MAEGIRLLAARGRSGLENSDGHLRHLNRSDQGPPGTSPRLRGVPDLHFQGYWAAGPRAQGDF